MIALGPKSSYNSYNSRPTQREKATEEAGGGHHLRDNKFAQYVISRRLTSDFFTSGVVIYKMIMNGMIDTSATHCEMENGIILIIVLLLL